MITSTGIAGDCGVRLEAAGFRQDALDMSMQYGTPITFNRNAEADVTRDDLGAISMREIDNGFNLFAMPVERQPDTRKLEKAGIRELCDVLIYTPILAWMQKGYIKDATLGKDFASIDITRGTVLLDGEEWKISDKGLSTRIGPYPVYITFGLRKN